MFVQFTDDKQQYIQSVFGGPQDPEVYPNQGEVEETDPRYLTFIESISPLVPDKATLAAVKRDELLSLAAIRIAPLQDAVDLDDATPEEVALLKKWKQYRVALNRLDLAADSIEWPDQPA